MLSDATIAMTVDVGGLIEIQATQSCKHSSRGTKSLQIDGWGLKKKERSFHFIYTS